MPLSYGAYKTEAERFCNDRGYDTSKYNNLERTELHIHMHSFVARYYSDAKEALKVEKVFENSFWQDHTN